MGLRRWKTVPPLPQVDGSRVSAQLLSGDARLQNAVKDSCHNILYAFSQSSLMNRYNSTTHIEQTMTWWRMAYMAAIAAFGILLLASGALYVVSSKRKEREVS